MRTRLKGFKKKNVRTTCLHPELCVCSCVLLSRGWLPPPAQIRHLCVLVVKLCETQSVSHRHFLATERTALTSALCLLEECLLPEFIGFLSVIRFEEETPCPDVASAPPALTHRSESVFFQLSVLYSNKQETLSGR